MLKGFSTEINFVQPNHRFQHAISSELSKGKAAETACEIAASDSWAVFDLLREWNATLVFQIKQQEHNSSVL